MSRKREMGFRDLVRKRGFVSPVNLDIPEREDGALVKYFLTNARCEKQ